MFKRICVEINGVFYKSLTEAKKQIFFDKRIIKNRCLSDEYPNYKIVPFRLVHNSKRCSLCDEIKILEEFPVAKPKLDNRSSWCRKCTNKKQCEAAKKDRTKANAKARKYYQTEKGKTSHTVRRVLRRAREKGGLVELTEEQKQLVKELYTTARKLRETGIDVVIDHIVPLNRGGKHHPDNLRIVSSNFNSRKGSKLDSELPVELLKAI